MTESPLAPPIIGLVFDDRYLTHDTGLSTQHDGTPIPFADPVPHVSSPVLVGRAMQLIDRHGIAERMVRIQPYPADDGALGRYHTADYLGLVAAISRTGGDTGDGAPIGVGGDRIARLSAGGVMAAVDAVMTGGVEQAYALVRPPGHHAMADRGMGFCVYNNVVVAARHAQARHGVTRIAILDWDVHHGNGTQDAFYADPDVLFISLHQDDLYPEGWGALDQTGCSDGVGSTINIPLPAGTGRQGYLAAFDRIIAPALRAFEPELQFVSAGQDASVLNPLARMCLTTTEYRDMTLRMLDLARELCGGRLVVAQEGGYAATYAPYCSTAIAAALVGLPAETLSDPYGPRAASQPAANVLGLDAAAALDAAVAQHRQHWPL